MSKQHKAPIRNKDLEYTTRSQTRSRKSKLFKASTYNKERRGKSTQQ
jgi:hypothetical protein